jgi:hypothetical protein
MGILRCLPPGPHSRGFKGSEVRDFGQRRQVGEILKKIEYIYSFVGTKRRVNSDG